MRVRVPYAQDSELPARPTGPYRIQADGAEAEVSVADAQVLRGAVIDVSIPGR